MIKGDRKIGKHFDWMKDLLFGDIVEFPIELRNIDGLANEKDTFLDFMEMGCSIWDETIS